jgi:ParB family chromosome partitioning protein
MLLAEIDRVESIPLENLVVGSRQARASTDDEGIEELAESISKIGLLEPILVTPANEDGLHEIITGQRRTRAHEFLGLTEIRASVLKERPEPNLAKAISLAENLIRKNLSTEEIREACTELYKEYGTYAEVSRRLGLPYNSVREYIGYEQLTNNLKAIVDSGRVDLRTALRAQKAATEGIDEVTSEPRINEQAAEVFALEMVGLDGTQQKTLEKLAKEDPTAPPEEIINKSRRQPKKFLVKGLTIGEDLYAALEKFKAKENYNKQTDAIVALLELGLDERGYL